MDLEVSNRLFPKRCLVWGLLFVVYFQAGLVIGYPGVPNEYPRGIDFDFDNQVHGMYGRLVVTRGGVRAPVPGIPLLCTYCDDPIPIETNSEKTKIIIQYQGTGGTKTVEVPLNVLEARLENAEALRSHRKKDYESAIRGFSKAIDLDPDFDNAATNLACAFAMSGKTREALEVVRPFLKSNPVKLYRKILTDPELRPLLIDPAIADLKSDLKGTATFDDKENRFIGGFVAYSSKYNLIAAISEIVQYSSGEGEDAVERRLLLINPETNQTVDDWSLPKNPVPNLNRFLADMGFVVPAEEIFSPHLPRKEMTSTQTIQIADFDINIVEKQAGFDLGGKAVLKRKGEIVAESNMIEDQYFNIAPTDLYWAALLPSKKLVVFSCRWYAGEGGGDWYFMSPFLLAIQ